MGAQCDRVDNVMQDQGTVLNDRFKADTDVKPAAPFFGVDVANNDGDIQNAGIPFKVHRKFDPGMRLLWRVCGPALWLCMYMAVPGQSLSASSEPVASAHFRVDQYLGRTSKPALVLQAFNKDRFQAMNKLASP